MIADLQNDSARWEADRQYREARGQGAGTYYYDDLHASTTPPNRVPETYRSGAYEGQRPEPRYQGAASYPEHSYQQPQSQPPHTGYGYSQPLEYQSVPSTAGGFAQPPQPATTSDTQHPQYVYQPGNGYSYPDPSNATRYPGGGVYDRNRPDYQTPPAASYPPANSPDHQRMSPMDPAYGSGAAGYPRGQSGRPPPPNDPHRRTR